jgi:hypothetical protein
MQRKRNVNRGKKLFFKITLSAVPIADVASGDWGATLSRY